LELQFLEIHKTHYLELSANFASNSYMPKSKTALENLKELILLDLKMLLGADIPWQRSGKRHEDSAALTQAGDGDDNSTSGGNEQDAAAADGNAAAASGERTKNPEPDSSLPPDPTNFLTWTPMNWERVDFDKISIPADQNPLKNKPCYAVVMLFLNYSAFCVKYKTVLSVECNIQREAHKRNSAEPPFQRTQCIYFS
jgi:hypothetical protein